jgi:signal transduction histidine kinase
MNGVLRRPLTLDCWRETAYLLLGGLTGTVAFTVATTGLSTAAGLAVLIVGLPVAVLFAYIHRVLCELDRSRAALVLGERLHGRYLTPDPARSLLARWMDVLTDRQTWRDVAWMVVGFPVTLTGFIAAVTVWSVAAGLLVFPAWAWALPNDSDWVSDHLVLVSILAPPAGVIAAAAGAWLIHWLAGAQARLAEALLGVHEDAPADAAAPAQARARARTPRDHAADLTMHAGIAALVGFTCTLLWSLTSRGTFWPKWVWFGLGTALALHFVVVRGIRAAGDREREYRTRVELCAVIAVACVAIWALTGAGYFWPVWPILGMGSAMAFRGAMLFRHHIPWLRERALIQRVDELTRTRSGAIDVQATELQRIERDLHDGAQARLVALSMDLGLAEQKLAQADPETAMEHIAEARGQARAAMAELRDLVRGIGPSILQDRGLDAALTALVAGRTPAVDLQVDVPRKPAGPRETAAYFVVAEALANARKHAHADRIAVNVRERDGSGRLVVEVADDGIGGAELSGGSGLAGLAKRIAALDGDFSVVSPPGGPTTVRAELP